MSFIHGDLISEYPNFKIFTLKIYFVGLDKLILNMHNKVLVKYSIRYLSKKNF